MLLATYVLKRLVWLVPVVLGVTILTFFISNTIPGDPARLVVGQFAPPDLLAKARHDLGLDQPVYVQYVRYLERLAHGDLGTSLTSKRPVTADLRDYFPATLELTTVSLLLSILVGVPLGVLSAHRKDGWLDQTGRFVALTGVAMPSFWLGLMLLFVFYLWLGWLPGSGRIDSFLQPPHRVTGLYLVDSLIEGKIALFLNALKHLILPAITQMAVTTGMLTRLTRSSMLEVLGQEYIKAARAKGLREWLVLYRHALRNSLLPVITSIGMIYGYLLGGSVLVETIFSWPGMGQYAVRAITFLDFPAVMGVTLVVAVMFVIVNLLADLCYFYIDPRIKLR